MLFSKQFVRKTKKGNVVKIVREHYLRDDIPCNSSLCDECNANVVDEECVGYGGASKLEAVAKEYKVIDTNIVLGQIDLLCYSGEGAITNVIIPQIVVEETKNRDMAIYKRIRDIINNKDRHFIVFSNEHHKETFVDRLPNESPNDRNDRAIRKVVQWYKDHLPQIQTVLISNDRDNVRKAHAEKLQAKTIQEYVRELENPAMIDLLATSYEKKTEEEDEDEPGKEYPFAKHTKLDIAKEGIQKGKYLKGMFRVGRDGPTSGVVRLGLGEQDLEVICVEHINRAVDGDIVIVEVLNDSCPSVQSDDSEAIPVDPALGVDILFEVDEENSPKPTKKAKIITIVKRNWKPYVGVVDPESLSDGELNAEWATCLPIDPKIPSIKIQTVQGKALKKKIVVVALDSWERSSKYPKGHLVKVLGDVGDVNAETEAILVMFDIPYSNFSPEALANLPTESWHTTPEEIAKRADFRNLRICSIDPPGCTDIDDALHHRLLPNGNSEVGVHIADVTHFVAEDSALDKEAWIRGNTVYLSNRRIDMLPGILGTNLCSLRSNVERYAFSVIWEINPEGEIVDSHYTRSVIKSVASLTYADAQDRFDDVNDHSDLTEDIRHLMRISRIIKRRRLEKGALTLASSEVKVVRNSETHEPIDVQEYQLRETNSLVEEFMLLANVSVAAKIHLHFPQFSMLRRHPVPPPTNFDALNKNLRLLGFELDVSSSKRLSETLDLAKIPGNEYFNTLIRIMTTRCMTQAVYFSSGTVTRADFLHYGLACDIYTHFTSPIRRYADVVVHRLLAACLGYIPISLTFTKDKVKRMCDVINKRHHTAQLAGRASVEFFIWTMLKDTVTTKDGYVTRICRDGFNVLVPSYGFEGWVPVSVEKVGNFVFDDQMKTLTFADKNITIKLFDKVSIKLSVQTTDVKRNIKVECVEPFLTGPVVTSIVENGDGESGDKKRKEPAANDPTSKVSNTPTVPKKKSKRKSGKGNGN